MGATCLGWPPREIPRALTVGPIGPNAPIRLRRPGPIIDGRVRLPQTPGGPPLDLRTPAGPEARRPVFVTFARMAREGRARGAPVSDDSRPSQSRQVECDLLVVGSGARGTLGRRHGRCARAEGGRGRKGPGHGRRVRLVRRVDVGAVQSAVPRRRHRRGRRTSAHLPPARARQRLRRGEGRRVPRGRSADGRVLREAHRRCSSSAAPGSPTSTATRPAPAPAGARSRRRPSTAAASARRCSARRAGRTTRRRCSAWGSWPVPTCTTSCTPRVRSRRSCTPAGASARHVLDLVRYGRGMHLVNGAALIARLMKSADDLGVRTPDVVAGVAAAGRRRRRARRAGRDAGGRGHGPRRPRRRAGRRRLPARRRAPARTVPAHADRQGALGAAAGRRHGRRRAAGRIGRRPLRSRSSRRRSPGARCRSCPTATAAPASTRTSSTAASPASSACSPTAAASSTRPTATTTTCRRWSTPRRGRRRGVVAVCDHAFQRRYAFGMSKPFPVPVWPYVRSGYLQRARTIEELAAACGIDPRGLAATVAEYNRHARRGEDPAFGRGTTPFNRGSGDPDHKPNPCVAPIETAAVLRDQGAAGKLRHVRGPHDRRIRAGARCRRQAHRRPLRRGQRPGERHGRALPVRRDQPRPRDDLRLHRRPPRRRRRREPGSSGTGADAAFRAAANGYAPPKMAVSDGADTAVADVEVAFELGQDARSSGAPRASRRACRSRPRARDDRHARGCGPAARTARPRATSAAPARSGSGRAPDCRRVRTSRRWNPSDSLSPPARSPRRYAASSSRTSRRSAASSARVAVRDDVLDDGRLDRAPRREHVRDVRRRRPRDDRDAAIAQRDDAFVRERAQRLPHDRPRHAEELAERNLLQLRAGRQAPLENGRAHGIADARLRPRLARRLAPAFRHGRRA